MACLHEGRPPWDVEVATATTSMELRPARWEAVMSRHGHVLVLAFATFAAICASALRARAQQAEGEHPIRIEPRTAARPARAAVNAAAETVWVGFTPGHAADNYWSIWSGTAAQGFGRAATHQGIWDFEPSYADVHGDSLQGWWPYRATMTGTG